MIRTKLGPSGGAAVGCTDGEAMTAPSGTCRRCSTAHASSARFCSQCGQRLSHDTAAFSDQPKRGGQAERRQVTVLFCDLVGSTELAARLDPEEMCQLMERYQETCGRAIAPFGGHIAQTLGDGVLVYFGYPAAHEDDGRRAVWAGLAIVEAFRDSENRGGDRRCAVRVGIHTGLVVAGELSRWDTRADMALVGETPNVAARLQALAQPNQVLLGPKTYRLVEGHFELHPLGPQSLKGLERPLPVWEARRATSPHARGDRPLRAATPLFGRDAELALLDGYWQSAVAGAGGMLVIAGPAGIGKSRLAGALRARFERDAPMHLKYHCSPYFQNSALHPIVEQIRFAAALQPDDAPERQWQKLQQLVDSSPARRERDTALIAQLLQLPAMRAEALPLSPQRQLDDLVEVLIEQLLKLSQRAPVLVTFEDAHWIDPTTLVFLQRLHARLPAARILVVITHRTRLQLPFRLANTVHHVSLERLEADACRSLIEHLSEQKRLPYRVTDEIVARSDGLPLFVEELTKAVLESDDPDARLCVPSSLQDSLTARLDRLGPLKVVAQLGACIGRSFSYALIAQVSALDPNQLRDGLLRLVAAELLIQRGEIPKATFRFRHALVQNTAYESLLRSERRRVHAAIARQLAARPIELEYQPEVLAQHWTAAGEHEAALELWWRAGRSAQRRSAHAEALAHLEAGLRSLETLPRTAPRDARELGFQLAIARSHTVGEGWSGRRVHEAYARALVLSRSTTDAAKECEVLWGLWAHHAVRGEFADALARADEYVERAEAIEDRRALLMADAAALVTHFCLGDFARAQQHATRIHRHYQPERDADLVHVFDHDPEVIASMYEGLWLWLQGFADRAADAGRSAVERARELHHPFQLCYALINGSAAFLWRGEYATVLAQIDEALELAAESRIPVFQVYGPLVGTAAFVERDPGPKVLAWLRGCLETMRGSQANMHLPFYELQLAAAYERAGDRAEAAKLIDRAIALAAATRERWIEPELHRVRARLLRADAGAEAGSAEDCLRAGLGGAQALGARALTLRLACDLAELLAADGRSAEARERLVSACESAPEGGDGPDVRRAQELLRRV